MHSFTLRVPDELAEDLRRAAARSGKSMNGWMVHVLRSAVDPTYAEPGTERLRERFRRAGILHEPGPRKTRAPDAARVARARKAAGRGKSLSDYVTEGRG